MEGKLTKNIGSRITHLVSPDTKARMYNMYQYYKLRLQYDAEARLSAVHGSTPAMSVRISKRRAYQLARAHFARENPDCYPPDRKTLERFEENLRVYNQFVKPKAKRRSTVRTSAAVDLAEQLLAGERDMSISNLGRKVGSSKTTAWRIVHQNLKYKTFKPMIVQKFD